jgi:hypothetical protein
MRRTRVNDHQLSLSQHERVRSSDRPVGYIGEFEATHGIESHDPNPVRDQRVFTALGSQGAALGMGHDSGTLAPEHHRAEVVVGMVVSQHQPLHRLPGDAPDGLQQIVALLRAGQRIDDHHSFAGHHKPGVGLTLRSPSGVSHGSIYSRSQAAKLRR